MYWLYKSYRVDKLPKEVYGFVYCIHYTDGTKYIGSKVVHSMRRIKPLKGMRKNAVRTKLTESNWRYYSGSSKLTEGKEIHSKEILYLTTNKRTMSYLEVRELMKVDASCNPEYVNENIGGKYFDNVLDGLYEGTIETHKGLFDE